MLYRNITSNRVTRRRALAWIVIASCAMSLGLGASACEDNICKKVLIADHQRQEECLGNYELGAIPDEVECPDKAVPYFECIHDCYSFQCDTPAGELNNCFDGC
jgi:hypothetical protein